MIILGLDALDPKMVKKFNCKSLMQTSHGKTDIGGFALERTVVLWASFLTGRDMEKDIPVEGQWEFKLPLEKTFFKFFNSFKAVDVPAFNLKLKNHEKEHKLLAGYFKERNTVEDFDEVVWENHKENRKDFMDSIGKYDVLMGYFDIADAIGHLSFGKEEKMRLVYEELEDLAGKTRRASDEMILIISDHGMKSIGRFGDHTKNGFYSFNQEIEMKLPKITDFFNLIKDVSENGAN